MVTLNPYIFFDGQAKEAMEFYKSVFGGKLDIQTMGDSPKEAQEAAQNPDPSRVMHAQLEGDVKIYASDSAQASKKSAKIELSLGGDDEPKLKAIFDKLGQGGKVSMPLAKQFWGDTFGMLTDKFGVDWMVNISAKK